MDLSTLYLTTILYRKYQQLNVQLMPLDDICTANYLEGIINSYKLENYPILLYELNENAIVAIYSDNYEKGLKYLIRGQIILEELCLGNYINNTEIALLTYHNMALCNQR